MPGTHHIWLRLIKRLCAVLVAGVLSHGPAAAADGDARQVVESLNAALLESMQNAAALGYDGRYRLLEPVLR